eukprot:1831791-Rhodomonas_salina.2
MLGTCAAHGAAHVPFASAAHSTLRCLVLPSSGYAICRTAIMMPCDVRYCDAILYAVLSWRILLCNDQCCHSICCAAIACDLGAGSEIRGVHGPYIAEGAGSSIAEYRKRRRTIATRQNQPHFWYKGDRKGGWPAMTLA